MGELGLKTFEQFIQKDFDTVLEIGPGNGKHFDKFREAGKQVQSVDFMERPCVTYLGDYMEYEFDPFDAIWCCHVLEHQPNVQEFLEKVHSELVEYGWLGIVVPPFKHALVGGHLSVWTAPLLAYRLILAGFNCMNAQVECYDYNIGLIVQKRTIEKLPRLHSTSPDIENLSDYFPWDAKQGFTFP